jgi:hypothetical protein
MMETNKKAMNVLARKAEYRDGFLGAAFHAVAAARRFTAKGVASGVGCSPGNIPRLMLCRVPRDSVEHFDADVRQISQFVGCCADRLANVVREYRSVAGDKS